MSIRLKSYTAAVALSIAIYAAIILPLAGCRSSQPPCADCWIVLRDQEAGR